MENQILRYMVYEPHLLLLKYTKCTLLVQTIHNNKYYSCYFTVYKLLIPYERNETRHQTKINLEIYIVHEIIVTGMILGSWLVITSCRNMFNRKNTTHSV